MASQIAAVFILALAFLAAGIDTDAATLVVTKTADTADSICDSDCSLREAIATAASGDTVVFSPLFNEPQTITLASGQISITRTLTINGPGRDLLTISGNNTNRIFRVTGGSTVTLTSMKLSNGLAATAGDAAGGAIAQTGGSLTLANMSITNNAARRFNQLGGNGGGIYIDNGTLLAAGSNIDNNSSEGVGGGILVFASGVSITDSSVNGNTGGGINGGGSSIIVVERSALIGNIGPGLNGVGGSITVRYATVQGNGSGILGTSSVTTIEQSLIKDNRAGVAVSGPAIIKNTTIRNNNAAQLGDRGAGLWINGNGPVYVFSSSIVNNTAFESGGGIYNLGAELFLTNSTISGNFARNGTGQAQCSGGGIHNAVAGGMRRVVLTNSTVADNRAQGSGGGICNDAGNIVITRNAIIAGNVGSSGSDFWGVVSSEGNNLISNTAGSSGWVSSDLQNTDPLIGPLGNNGGYTWTHALFPKSPAINGGNNALALDPNSGLPLIYDQRGPELPRIVNGNVDIGSYEASYATAPVTVGGRVLVSASERGVDRVRITFTDNCGNVRYTQTNPLGYYRFFELAPGMTYTVAVSHKSYQFDSPQFVTIDQPRDNLDFVAIGR